MSEHLAVFVLPNNRQWHGDSWPPSPGRAFQTFVAAAAESDDSIPAVAQEALTWLESLEPPLVATPAYKQGPTYTSYVPNNDADVEEPDKIKRAKTMRGYILEDGNPILFAWKLQGEHQAECESLKYMAKRVCQFGRTIDTAVAWVRTLSTPELDELLASYAGIYEPGGSGRLGLLCPTSGTLQSLERRHKERNQKFRPSLTGRGEYYVRASAPLLRQVVYGGRYSSRVFDLRTGDDTVAHAIEHVAPLVVRIRDGLATRLTEATPELHDSVERFLIGRGENVPVEQRIRIIPIPSIGHKYADHEVRRVLVEVPPTCPLAAKDVYWACDHLELTLDGIPTRLMSAEDASMLTHYGGDHRYTYGSVTPVVLGHAPRDLNGLAGKVRVALRQAAVHAPPLAIRVDKVHNAAAFVANTRFNASDLYHVKVTFSKPPTRRVVIGDGRYLGLGLLAPVFEAVGLYAFEVSGQRADVRPTELVHQFRRAIIARAQALAPGKPVDPFFHGHTEDGAPLRGADSDHLAYQYDPRTRQLLIIAPHLFEPGAVPRQRQLASLQTVLDGFTWLSFQGSNLRLARVFVEAPAGSARAWETVTAYVVNRARKDLSAAEAVVDDMRRECGRLGLPIPHIALLGDPYGSEHGWSAHMRVVFPTPIMGPLLAGRMRHKGGGLFVRAAP